jgi:predicted nucleotide-binding protein (sugar kinase/HSP70/actin superfamily)
MGYKPPEAIDRLTQQGPLAKQEGRLLRIAVLGHPYLVYDETANHHLLKALADAGARMYTQETIPLAERNKEWPGQNKTVYWLLGQQILAAALYYTVKERMDGLVFLSACLCGPDALIGELLARYLASYRHAPPLLKLTVDEHTSEVGLLTRIEAFIDLLCWKKGHATV